MTPTPTNILLTTLNSTYQHCAFGLRYLYANLGELQSQAQICEFTIAQNSKDVVEKILKLQPKIVGFGVYIWNTEQTLEVVSVLKKVAPEIVVVVGGPEVSHESETQALAQAADYVIKGEADFLFYEFCQQILTQNIPPQKIIAGALPDIKKIKSPYSLYTNEDIRNRVIYVEVSRGCPYKCEYCLSSLDKSVRSFDLDLFLQDMHILIERGVRQFKFVDRTFNLSIGTSTKILEFFLERIHHGLFLHFELVPDRLPNELKDLIKKFPAGSLQFEIGIQTWNPEVAALVSRKNDYSKVRENFRFLRNETHVHTHADLIAGLPGESIESFARGFDELASVEPDEIQVGILKRLKGTPIIRHDQEWQMRYQDFAPFQVISTKTMSFQDLQSMSRYSRFWDHYANSGQFIKSLQLIKNHVQSSDEASLFWFFYRFTEFLHARHGQSHAIALVNLAESLWIYLTQYIQLDKEEVAQCLIADYCDGTKKRDMPHFLKSETVATSTQNLPLEALRPATPNRQQRHNKQLSQ